jgi:hypothetical protein
VNHPINPGKGAAQTLWLRDVPFNPGYGQAIKTAALRSGTHQRTNFDALARQRPRQRPPHEASCAGNYNSHHRY